MVNISESPDVDLGSCETYPAKWGHTCRNSFLIHSRKRSVDFSQSLRLAIHVFNHQVAIQKPFSKDASRSRGRFKPAGKDKRDERGRSLAFSWIDLYFDMDDPPQQPGVTLNAL